MTESRSRHIVNKTKCNAEIASYLAMKELRTKLTAMVTKNYEQGP
jgi:hypothetical protein